MLPENAIRTLTIYPRWVYPTANLVKPMRRVLKECSYEERSIATALQTGNILREPAVIRVFADTSGKTYIPPEIWETLSEDELDGYWTCDPIQRPLIASFESEHEFAFNTATQITREENALTGTPGIHRVVERNDNEGQRNDNGILIAKKLGAHIRIRV